MVLSDIEWVRDLAGAYFALNDRTRNAVVRSHSDAVSIVWLFTQRKLHTSGLTGDGWTCLHALAKRVRFTSRRKGVPKGDYP